MGNIQHASAGLAGPTVRRHRGDESGRAEQTSHGSRLLRSKDTGRRGIGSGGVRRGLLAMQAGLASIPLHMIGLLTHRWRCSESSWEKFWKNI